MKRKFFGYLGIVILIVFSFVALISEQDNNVSWNIKILLVSLIYLEFVIFSGRVKVMMIKGEKNVWINIIGLVLWLFLFLITFFIKEETETTISIAKAISFMVLMISWPIIDFFDLVIPFKKSTES